VSTLRFVFPICICTILIADYVVCPNRSCTQPPGNISFCVLSAPVSGVRDIRQIRHCDAIQVQSRQEPLPHLSQTVCKTMAVHGVLSLYADAVCASLNTTWAFAGAPRSRPAGTFESCEVPELQATLFLNPTRYPEARSLR
jgi:hypothetical protein